MNLDCFGLHHDTHGIMRRRTVRPCKSLGRFLGVWAVRLDHAMRTINGGYLTVRRLVSKPPTQAEAMRIRRAEQVG